MLDKLKGYRTYLALATAFVVAVNEVVQAVDLDNGVAGAVISGLVAAAAYFRSRAGK